MSSVSPEKAVEPPEGWGNDNLSAFLDKAHTNVYATYTNKHSWFLRVKDIDSVYVTLIQTISKEEDLTFGFLIMRSHASFRAACQIAMAGLPPECFMLLRGALESALYGLHIKLKPEHEADWLNRPASEAARAKSKQVFSYGNVKETFRKTGCEHFGVMERLYEDLIDYGAHPNEGSVTANATITDKDKDSKEVLLKYMVGDSLQLEHVLITTARVGACCLYIIKEGNPDRFAILGLDYLLDKIANGI